MRGVTYAVMEKLRRLPFQLTRLMRGVTVVSIAFISNVRFQLTRLMRGVTRELEAMKAESKNFNSHASCEA